MKKFFSTLLIVSLILTVINLPVFASNVTPDIVHKYTFNNGRETWSTIGSASISVTTPRLVHDGSCLLTVINDSSWASPRVNIYNMIKAEGPGTYTVHAKVLVDEYLPYFSCRMIMRSTESYSFLENNFTSLGVKTEIYNDRWTDVSGSFKVQASDLEKTNGHFWICFDSISDDYDQTHFYIDDVIICKLNENDVTNGQFQYGMIGWQNWGGSGNFTIENQSVLGIPYGHYLKVSTYSSVACNVDQILAKYRSLVYRISFDIYISNESYNNLNQMIFYLSTKDGSQTCYLYQPGQLRSGGWTHFSFNINTFNEYNNSGLNIFQLLNPDINEVVFRIEYRSKSGAAESSYGIRDLTFVPLVNSNNDGDFKQIGANHSHDGALSLSNKEDFYVFIPTKTAFYEIYTTGNTTDSFGEIYPASANYRLTYDDDSGESFNFKISTVLYAHNVYYIKITKSPKAAGYGEYSLTVNLKWLEVNKPVIQQRSTWNPNEPNTEYFEPRGTAVRVIFHHSADKFSSTDFFETAAEIKRIQVYHMTKNNPYADIGYHYIIDPSGRIWEGRKLEYKGAHTPSYNDDIGILLLGDFESRIQNGWNPDTVSDAMFESMQALTKWLCYSQRLEKNNASGGERCPINIHYNYETADGGSTECPGDNAIPKVNQLDSIIRAWCP